MRCSTMSFKVVGRRGGARESDARLRKWVTFEAI